MAKTNVKPHEPELKRVKQDTIAEQISRFLVELRLHSDPSNVMLYQNILGGTLSPYLDRTGRAQGLTEKKESFCNRAPANEIIPYIDHFFRYHLIRELSLDPNTRATIAQVCVDFGYWLSEQKALSAVERKRLELILDRFVELDSTSLNAARTLQAHTSAVKEPRKVVTRIDFGKHDVVRREGCNVWLEIWSLPELPTEQLIGPIALPPAVAEVVEVGWIIACEVVRGTDENWIIVESGNVYASLPFNSTV